MRVTFTLVFLTLTSTVLAGVNMKTIGNITTKITKKIENQISHINETESRLYRELYPTFMDGCASGQVVHLNGNRGSALGHATVFIKGACIDKNAAFPQVTTECAPGEDEVGVSANGQFMNVNWIALPTEKTFFNGDIEEGSVLDDAYREEYIKKMSASGFWKNIQARNTSTKAPLPSTDKVEYNRLMIKESITLDVGLTWGRQTVCQRVPMSKNQIQRVVDFLNKKNQYYYVEGHTYTWDMWGNSCGHLAQNAFAAAGIMTEKKVDSNLLSLIPNISVPSNFFYNLASKTTLNDFPSVRDIYRDRIQKKLLLEDGIIANQAGATSRYHPVYGVQTPELNKLFNATESRTGVLPINLFETIGQRLERLFQEEKHFDLKENLKAYEVIYEKALEDAKNIAERRSSNRNFEAVLQKYIEVVEAQLADTKEKIVKIEELSQ